jgi:hypothetical protein
MFGLWVGSGYQATSVTWAITTEPFAGTTLGSGTSNVLSSGDIATSAFFATQLDVDIDQVFIAIPNLALDGGATYYLEMDGVTSSDPNSIGAYWDESDGPSSAYSDYVPFGSLGIAGPSTASQSFQILGTEEGPAVTPEPSSFLLLGSGLLGLAWLMKRKLTA